MQCEAVDPESVIDKEYVQEYDFWAVHHTNDEAAASIRGLKCPPETFVYLLAKHNIATEPEQVVTTRLDSGEPSTYEYVWAGAEMLVVTARNPKTGVMMDGRTCDDAVGTTGYVGFSGTPTGVNSLLDAFLEHDDVEVVEDVAAVSSVDREERRYI